MSLRPLIEIAAENERLHALAPEALARASDPAAEPLAVGASSMLRPLLLAALLEDDRGLGRPPGAARRPRRPLGPRPGRRPARLPGAPAGPPLSLARHRLRLACHASAAPRRPADRRARLARAARTTRSSSPAPPRSPRPSRTPPCARPGFSLERGGEVDLEETTRDLVAAGYERVEQVEERGQFALRGGILDVFPATEERAVRIELFGDEVESMRWFSTFTQRSLGEAERVELAPAAELDVEHRELAELAAMEAAEDGEEAPSLAEVLPLDHFGAPLDLVPETAAVVLAAAEEIEPALRDHWEDATTAMHADDARHLYVDVAGPARGPRGPLPDRGRRRGRRDAFRASRAESPARSVKEAEARARETGPLRLPHGRRLRQHGGGGALPLRPRPDRRLDPRRRPPLARARARLRRGPPARGLRQPRAEARRLSLPAARPPPPADRGASTRRRPRPARLQRPAGRRPRRPRGPRRRPLRRLRDPRGRRRHPRLPLPRIQGRGPGLRPHRPAREAEPLRRRRRRPDPLGAGRQTLAEHEGPRAPRRGRPGRRAAQPLRRAQDPPRPPLRPGRRMADRDGDRLPLPRDRRPGRSDRGGQGGHGVRAADGPPGLRRRRLRQDRGGAARRGQGRLRRQAGDDAGADDDPRPAAPRHLPRAARRPALRRRGGLAAAQAGRGEDGPRRLRGGRRSTS